MIIIFVSASWFHVCSPWSGVSIKGLLRALTTLRRFGDGSKHLFHSDAERHIIRAKLHDRLPLPHGHALSRDGEAEGREEEEWITATMNLLLSTSSICLEICFVIITTSLINQSSNHLSNNFMITTYSFYYVFKKYSKNFHLEIDIEFMEVRVNNKYLFVRITILFSPSHQRYPT